jgi:hypothetical protein
MTFVTELRTKIIRAAGASGEEVGELFRHNKRHFGPIDSVECLHFPLPDETFVDAWERYAEETTAAGSIAVLAAYLPQLGFPIRKGISRTLEYNAAMCAGAPADEPRKCALGLVAPERCYVKLHVTPAGRVPVIIASERRDFVTLVRALTASNEPAPIPRALDGITVSGFKNWHRTGLQPGGSCLQGGEVLRDRFLIVSAEPYDGVPKPPSLSDEEWRSRSAFIRCEHESAHYFTRRLLGSMRNVLLDEVISHFYGVVCGLRGYRAQWLFDGLGMRGAYYQTDAKLEIFRGNPPLSDGALRCLLRIVKAAARNLETFHKSVPWPFASVASRAVLLLTLSAFTLEELASPEAPDWLLWEFRRQSGLRDKLENEGSAEPIICATNPVKW